jgi:hypothetical protein
MGADFSEFTLDEPRDGSKDDICKNADYRKPTTGKLATKLLDTSAPVVNNSQVTGISI